ncbi:MAG TPA: aminoacyl-tRNA hydrolase [Candidatus Dormibacteraeota bacterium]|nr:aminoacyl-tRNA hydrolase [Candidatus Dormibacteraeota bacterium]
MPETNRSPTPDLVLVGLGNPGADYAQTRHNLGWACLEAYARGAGIELSRRRWRSRVGSGEVAGHRLWLLEPQTFMNLSGRAVFEALRDLGLGPEEVWVVYDEMDLPLCRLRIRRGGSSAGHKGIESIIASLHSDAFVRFRVGVGKQVRPGSGSGIAHVLGNFSGREAEVLDSVIEGVASAIEVAVREGLTRAMDLYNRAGSLGCEEIA